MTHSMNTIETWQKFLIDCNKQSIQELCVEILKEIDGYGIEYGFDTDNDGEDLANAFQALNNIKAEESQTAFLKAHHMTPEEAEHLIHHWQARALAAEAKAR